jgi:hypothetical protein
MERGTALLSPDTGSRVPSQKDTERLTHLFQRRL